MLYSRLVYDGSVEWTTGTSPVFPAQSVCPPRSAAARAAFPVRMWFFGCGRYRSPTLSGSLLRSKALRTLPESTRSKAYEDARTSERRTYSPNRLSIPQHL
jgi:hypothetical protein